MDTQVDRQPGFQHFKSILLSRLKTAWDCVLTLSQTTDFRLFQTTCADDNFKFDENDRKSSKWVENTVGKGEIARYGQFLLFLQCFQKICTADT